MVNKLKFFSSDYSAKVLLYNFERNSNKFDLEGMIVLCLPCVFVDDIEDDVYYSLNFKHKVDRESIESKTYEILNKYDNNFERADHLRKLFLGEIDDFEDVVLDLFVFDINKRENSNTYELEYRVFTENYDKGFNRCMERLNRFKEILEKIKEM